MLLLLARITAYNDWTIDAVAWQLRADAAANVAKFSDAASEDDGSTTAAARPHARDPVLISDGLSCRGRKKGEAPAASRSGTGLTTVSHDQVRSAQRGAAVIAPPSSSIVFYLAVAVSSLAPV